MKKAFYGCLLGTLMIFAQGCSNHPQKVQTVETDGCVTFWKSWANSQPTNEVLLEVQTAADVWRKEHPKAYVLDSDIMYEKECIFLSLCIDRQ